MRLRKYRKRGTCSECGKRKRLNLIGICKACVQAFKVKNARRR
jgi:hypothetical protein